MNTTIPTKPTKIIIEPKPTTSGDALSADDLEGPSWGLIIPILMIGVFLLCVVLCLWWHKWRGKTQTLGIANTNSSSSSAFQRSYRSNRKSRNGFDAIRDSTRSTLPLRNSINEKNITKRSNSISKVQNVNVIPVQKSGSGKYSFYWDKNHWKAYPTPTLSSSGRLGQKPLSPIEEINSPNSMKLSELSLAYDIKAQRSFSPYHLAWSSSSNAAPPSYEQSERNSYRENKNRFPPPSRKTSAELNINPFQGYEPATNSPFFPNNNTPTTECDTGSESSQFRYIDQSADSSQTQEYFPNLVSNSGLSVSNTRLTLSADTGGHTSSFGTSYPESSYLTSSQQQSYSGLQSTFPSGQTSGSTDAHTTNLSSLPSSIAQFSKQNLLLEDENNNSMFVPNAYMSFPLCKAMNYTLASSVASSDTHLSDNTSMLPNVGSNNTSDFPTTISSVPPSNPQSIEQSHVSPEDLSKLVDEMSSIRPVDDSCLRPNSSMDPASRIVSISGMSGMAELQRSWSVAAEMEYLSQSSMNTSSQPTSQTDASLYWDSYPLNGNHAVSKSYPDLPLHVMDMIPSNFVGPIQPAPNVDYHAPPVLMDKQYWV